MTNTGRNELRADVVSKISERTSCCYQSYRNAVATDELWCRLKIGPCWSRGDGVRCWWRSCHKQKLPRESSPRRLKPYWLWCPLTLIGRFAATASSSWIGIPMELRFGCKRLECGRLPIASAAQVEYRASCHGCIRAELVAHRHRTFKRYSNSFEALWVILPEANAEFAAHVEDVLDVYSQPYNTDMPVLCMDEQPVQHAEETRTPIAASHKHAKRVEYEYKRAGVPNVFMFAEPLANCRHVSIRTQKTKVDWAAEMGILLQGRYAKCSKVIVVCDNLNKHTIGAFYEVFEPSLARRASCFEKRNRLERDIRDMTRGSIIRIWKTCSMSDRFRLASGPSAMNSSMINLDLWRCD